MVLVESLFKDSRVMPGLKTDIVLDSWGLNYFLIFAPAYPQGGLKLARN